MYDFNKSKLRYRFIEAFDEDACYSYFDRSHLSDGGLILTPWSGPAEKWFNKNAMHFLERNGVKLGRR